MSGNPTYRDLTAWSEDNFWLADNTQLFSAARVYGFKVLCGRGPCKSQSKIHTYVSLLSCDGKREGVALGVFRGKRRGPEDKHLVGSSSATLAPLAVSLPL